MRLFLLVALYFISLASFAQTSKDSIDFSITFSGCFNKDMVGLKINGKNIFKDISTTTEDVNSLSNVGLYQDEQAMWVIINKTKEKKGRIPLNEKLICEVSFNNKIQTLIIDLKDGNNIFFDNCRPQGTVIKLNVKQFKGIVYLD